MYNYEEALKIIEHFMEESGIRHYCYNVCRGACCTICRIKTCMSGHRNVACSAYVCPELLGTIGCKKTAAILDRLRLKTKVGLGHKNYDDVYFEKLSKEKEERFSIDVISVDSLEKVDISTLSRKMSALSQLSNRAVRRRETLKEESSS